VSDVFADDFRLFLLVGVVAGQHADCERAAHVCAVLAVVVLVGRVRTGDADCEDVRGGDVDPVTVVHDVLDWRGWRWCRGGARRGQCAERGQCVAADDCGDAHHRPATRMLSNPVDVR
jgi:hypothetical protein